MCAIIPTTPGTMLLWEYSTLTWAGKRRPFAKVAARLNSVRRAQTPSTECNSRYNLALVYALTGEVDQALPLVERLLRTPGATTRTGFL